MAKIIVFSNLKGGVGKSTLCCHFAHFLVAKNQKVAVLDADLSHNIYNLRQRELAKVKDAVKPWEVWTLDAAASTDAVIIVLL
jgi:chromosome partitioning protein